MAFQVVNLKESRDGVNIASGWRLVTSLKQSYPILLRAVLQINIPISSVLSLCVGAFYTPSLLLPLSSSRIRAGLPQRPEPSARRDGLRRGHPSQEQDTRTTTEVPSPRTDARYSSCRSTTLAQLDGLDLKNVSIATSEFRNYALVLSVVSRKRLCEGAPVLEFQA